MKTITLTGKKSKESPIISYPLELGSGRIGEIHINNLLPQKDMLTEEDKELVSRTVSSGNY